MKEKQLPRWAILTMAILTDNEDIGRQIDFTRVILDRIPPVYQDYSNRGW